MISCASYRPTHTNIRIHPPVSEPLQHPEQARSRTNLESVLDAKILDEPEPRLTGLTPELQQNARKIEQMQSLQQCATVG